MGWARQVRPSRPAKLLLSLPPQQTRCILFSWASSKSHNPLSSSLTLLANNFKFSIQLKNLINPFSRPPSFKSARHRTKMRLSTLIAGSIASIALPFAAGASPHAHGHGRRHNDVAHRARGDVSNHLYKRFDNVRYTWYDVGL